MNFKEAFELLKEGEPIKREEWNGYWDLDDFGDLIIHLEDGFNIDLVDTDDIMYTLSHTTQDDWQIATINNCARLKEEKFIN